MAALHIINIITLKMALSLPWFQHFHLCRKTFIPQKNYLKIGNGKTPFLTPPRLTKKTFHWQNKFGEKMQNNEG